MNPETIVQLEAGLAGVRIGHWSGTGSGCTVVLFEPGTVASVEVRGGAPASRELDVLNPMMSVAQINGAVLTGGSAFGLDSAQGVMRFLAEQGRGVATPGGPVPIVPILGLFDLAAGVERPNADSGYAAATAARAGELSVGLVGAGVGACSSRWRGASGEVRSGLVYAQRTLGDLVVGALCAVNAFGDILRPGDTPTMEAAAAFAAISGARTHTTIGVLFTNATLDKLGCHLLAQGAHDGLARAVHPPHTRLDGDAFIAAATGKVVADLDTVRMLGMLAVTEAISAA